MSESNQKSQSEQRFEALSKELAEIKTFLKQQIEPKTISHEEHEEKPKKHEHETVDHLEIVNCPECKKALDEFGKNFHKKMMEAKKDNPYECESCGEKVKLEEESCPTCGGKKARKRG